MATEDKVILELLKSHTTLTSDNRILELGQRVFVTGITDALGNGEKIGDGSTAYTSLKWQRYELIKSIDLTSGNSTYTLPEILGGPQKVSIYWTNGGTYKLTLAVTDGATVGGETAATWEGEGNGHIELESDGSNWQVREYEDSGAGWKKNGRKLDCWFVLKIPVAASSNFTDSSAQNWAHEFSDIESWQCSAISNYGNTVATGAIVGNSATTTAYKARAINVFQSSNTVGDCDIGGSAVGTW